MDHIPHPPGVVPLRVPYVADAYDNGGFMTYPARRGIEGVWKPLDFRSRRPADWQAFFQAWLYFGCLTEVFKILDLDVDHSQFVRRTEWGDEVFSAALHVYIDEWKFRNSAYRKKERRESIWQQISLIMSQVRRALAPRGPVDEFGRYLSQLPRADPDLAYWPNIALSIALLGRSLLQVGYILYAAPKDWRQYPWGTHAVLTERLRSNKWCEAEIARVIEDQTLDFVLYVGGVRSPRAEHDHTRCSGITCRVRQASVAAAAEHGTAKQHTPGCTQESCKLWVMPESSQDVVQAGGVPLARWSDDKGLELVRLDKDKDQDQDVTYVAISHVWSDGKGNRDVNGLPECQLRALQQKVDSLYAAPRRNPRPVINSYGPKKIHAFRNPWRKPVGFWMDTLCVPVGKAAKQRHLRARAIAQMRQIYEGADRVLVLDDWIQELSTASSINEKAVRICLSNWQHRLWTLQEGVLAQHLCIQFSDGQLSLDEIKEQKYVEEKNGPSPHFYSYISRGLSAVPIFNLFFALDMEDHVPELASLFSPLIPAIGQRTTTDPQDETVCMATLLHMDTAELQSISTTPGSDSAQVCERRMVLFLCKIRSFEQRIIFNPLARLQTHGFRWAPRSFLGQSKSALVEMPDSRKWGVDYSFARILDQGEDQADSPPRGLVVTYSGVMLRDVPLSELRTGTFYMHPRAHGSSLYRVSLDLGLDLDLPGDDPDSEWVAQHDANEYALVISGPALLMTPQSPEEEMPAVFGILRGETRAGIPRLQHVCIASIAAIDPALADRENAHEAGAEGEWTDIKEWCIV